MTPSFFSFFRFSDRFRLWFGFFYRTFCYILTMLGCALKRFPSRVKRTCFFLEMTPRHWAYMYFFSLGNAVQGFTCVAFVDFFLQSF